MTRAERLYKTLIQDFGFKEATGSIQFVLKDFRIDVEQNNIVGNILEEWLSKWLTERDIPHVHNLKQSSPDFWLNPKDHTTDWLEIKSFMSNPGFDVAAFRSFINLIIDEPYKLQSDYLLIKYKMEGGIITIEDCWLKKIWEICCASNSWPLKVQYKNKTIVNIRPAVWYSEKSDYPVFESLEDFLSAVEETIYTYHDTHHLADNWSKEVCKHYEAFYHTKLIIPRWMDIKEKYIK